MKINARLVRAVMGTLVHTIGWAITITPFVLLVAICMYVIYTDTVNGPKALIALVLLTLLFVYIGLVYAWEVFSIWLYNKGYLR